MDERLQARRRIRGDLAIALDRGDLIAWFQPIVDLATGCVQGAEALARMRKPDGEIVEPAVFVPVAETSGLIIPLGRTMITQAVQFAAHWVRSDPSWTVAVNVTTRELLHDSYADFVLGEIARLRLRPANLRVEVTEQVIMDAAGTVPRVLQRLHDAGVGIVLDDFGTGFSSLTALRELPARVVKIDRAFTRRILDDDEDCAIAHAVSDVSHDLGRLVVAEGIELADQWALLSQWGCDLGQGYLFGRPVPAEEFDGGIRRPAAGLRPPPNARQAG